MATFTYEARTGAGQRQTGVKEGASAAEVVTSLRSRGWLVLNVRPVEGNAQSTDWREILNPLAWLPARSVDVELSLQQIAVMLRSGLTLLAALKTTAEHARRPAMRKVWTRVTERIQQGATLADAMKDHACFPRIVLQLVRVGEATGTLDVVMSRSAEALEHRRLLKSQVITALTYPTIVLIAALGATTFMVVGVLPKLGVFLQSLGRRLPPMTQNLLDLSAFVQTHGVAILVTMFALIILAVVVCLYPPTRFHIDRWILRMPIIGHLLRLGATVQFAHALGVLLESGITVVEGLRTAEQLSGNRYLASLVSRARDSILRGSGLAMPLMTPGAFMPMLPRMVAVGESAGTLQEVLSGVARFHENQLRGAIRWLGTIIEPAIVVVVGGIVGYVYIAFFVALFSAAGGAR